VLGQYIRQPITNSWHRGKISIAGNTVQWENEAGVSWPLSPNLAQEKLLTNAQCPYFNRNGGAFVIKSSQSSDGSAIVEGFWFLGELYTRQ
jgi:hypothetical protein